MPALHAFLTANPVLRDALVGFLTAVAVDFHAWKSWQDVAFNWKTASYRWVTGALFGTGIGAL